MRETALNAMLILMRGDLKIRKVQTSSGATAVQIIQYTQGKRIIVKHIGSAQSDEELSILLAKAEVVQEQLCVQPSLFVSVNDTESTQLVNTDHLMLDSVTHCFAYDVLRKCCHQCGLSSLPSLYQDLSLMRIIEPTSKLRTIELLERYFGITYAPRTVYRWLPSLITYKEAIEKAAYKTAQSHFSQSLALVLYDVTTLYFESHKADDELLARGFSKDDKSKQPQIVIGLLVTQEGFPLMHEIYKGNTFEGHTMLSVVKTFQQQHPETKPIIVADAAMLSRENMHSLEVAGYYYIVGARLANAPKSLVDAIVSQLTRTEGSIIRLSYPKASYEVICSYSEKRYKKDHRQFQKHIAKAKELIDRNEPGKRAKFVKKSSDDKTAYTFDDVLKEKTENLLGIKGYCTNIPEAECSNQQIIDYYHELWHVEQAFRMSKTDLKTRPVFHHRHEAIKAHVLLCFMGLMIGKFLEIKTGLSLRRIRDILWKVHEAHIRDKQTGKTIKLQTNLDEYLASGISELLKPH